MYVLGEVKMDWTELDRTRPDRSRLRCMKYQVSLQLSLRLRGQIKFNQSSQYYLLTVEDGWILTSLVVDSYMRSVVYFPSYISISITSSVSSI